MFLKAVDTYPFLWLTECVVYELSFFNLSADWHFALWDFYTFRLGLVRLERDIPRKPTLY